MRKGENPAKDGSLIEKNYHNHRVIIPLHIPYEGGYYKDSYQIFEISLLSLLKTSVSKLKISVVSNGCCAHVNSRLLALYKENKIDELIIEKESIGKINSVLKALRTVDERIITISDADVLYDNGWEQAIFQVFQSFPKAGAVCPIPVFRKHFDLTSNIWLRYLLSKRIKFRPVKNVEALSMFGKSLGWKWLEPEFSDVIGTINATNGEIAVLGCSHLVASYKKEVFSKLPAVNAEYKLESICEYEYTDLPVLKMGGYRLSTYDNYAYHMGNVFEPWMLKKFDETFYNEKQSMNYSLLPNVKYDPLFLLKEKFFKKLLSVDKIKRTLLKKKGLTLQQIHNFLEKKYI